MSMPRSVPRSVALVVLIAFLLASAASGGTSVSRASASTTRCKVVGKGTPWSYQGQKGTAYTVVGDRRTACAVGIKWLVRLTNMRGVPKTPPGWDCIAAVAVTGQCSSKSGGTFEWTAKLK